ncbi:Nif3-like dinuclear metal center hexameric protein [Streptococcus sp. S784/96/1]|uniref:Nif3-like dinuclear metal center hexameric protein n=1 Tax=Streptococcus sp. S784/96/1 TaxID=2653499 RepID=UPI0013893D36|nr:Nif3-like dinuclear metal center hexameric protein [Streptococcus sp. S784/96/1]
MVTIGEVVQLLENDRKGITPSDGIIHRYNLEAECTGIMVSFSASIKDIERAYQQKCNLLISHEGIYYSHNNSHFLDTPISIYKKELLEKYGIVVYRNHDSVHRSFGDYITKGLVEQLNWNSLVTKEGQYYSIIENTYSVGELLTHLSESLRLNGCRYFGDINATVNKLAVLVGYRGSAANIIDLIAAENPNAIIIGEGPEWEYIEFVKDILQVPYKSNLKALIIIGHAESEKYGMDYYATNYLSKRLSIPIYFSEDTISLQFF